MWKLSTYRRQRTFIRYMCCSPLAHQNSYRKYLPKRFVKQYVEIEIVSCTFVRAFNRFTCIQPNRLLYYRALWVYEENSEETRYHIHMYKHITKFNSLYTIQFKQIMVSNIGNRSNYIPCYTSLNNTTQMHSRI